MQNFQLKGLLDYNSENPKLGSYILFFFGLLLSLFIILTSVNLLGNTLIYLAITIGFLGIFLIVAKPVYWVYSIVFLTGLFATDTGGGVSATDVLFAIYFNVTLYFWILYSVLINKKKLIASKLDWLLIAFFIFISITSLTTFYFDIEFLIWLREYSLFTLILYYFPFKEIITDKKKIISVMLLFLVSAIFAELIQLYRYKNIISNVVYAYQLGTSIRINQTLYIVAVSFSFIFIFQIKNFLLRYLNLFTIILGVTALLTTYSRIFWASLLINFLLIFIFINNREKIKSIGYVILSVSLVYIAAFLLFGDFLDIALSFIERRFSSSSKGTKDISAMSRLAEWEVVISLIKESPFLGQGYGNPFTFNNPITTWKEYSITIHNGYLFLAYRIGIPLALFYLTFYFSMFAKSIFLVINIKNNLFYKKLIFGVSLAFFSIFITNFLTSTFVQRDGIMISAICYAFVFIVGKKFESGEIE